MNSPVRRILGDKDKNIHLHVESPKKVVSSSSSISAAKARKPSDMATPSSPKLGDKRKIAEVEEAERVEDQITDSQRTQFLSDNEQDVSYMDSSTSHAQHSYHTMDTSFSASQNPLEQHFELQQEEMSQRTLDKLNEVPMPQNNSQLPPLKPAFLRDTSAGSVGLSHFINFEGIPSSQVSDVVQRVEPDTQPQAQLEVQRQLQPPKEPGQTTSQSLNQPSIDTAARKKMLSEKAAELATRLQLALYKVQTKQTSQPFSRLKFPKKPRPARQRSSSPASTTYAHIPSMSTPRFHSSSTIREPSSARTIIQSHAQVHLYPPPPLTSVAAQTYSAEATIAAMRSAAANQLKPPVRNLNSLPMPQLDPALVSGATTQSAKTSSKSEHDSHDENQQFPSSPPLSRQPSAVGSISEEDIVLPGGLESVLAQEPAKVYSSPPASDDGERERMNQDERIRVSQGEAASGLVQLLTSGGHRER